MSHYTTEVRWIVETNSSPGTVMQRCTEAAPAIFDFPYPIWEESAKLDLETKILMAYYTQEIGFETVGLWKLKLASKLNNIMPYYIDLYNTTIQKFDPLNPTYLTETIARGKQSTGMDVHQSKGQSEIVNSGGNTNTETLNEFPQSNLSPTGDYATSQRVDEQNLGSQVNNTASSNLSIDHTGKETENITNQRKGNLTGKTQAELLQSMRDAIINIDSMIIAELSDLFMLLW